MVKKTTGRALRGFTLVEVLVVLAIVALLASLAVPRFFGGLQRAREAALVENLRVMRVAIDRFEADRGRLPESLDELVRARYLTKVPMDPVTESDRTWVLKPSPESGRPGVVDVMSGARGVADDGRAYSAF